MAKRLTTEKFIRRAKAIHGDKYDYSKVVYTNNTTRVCIICPIHGEFWQKPVDHLRTQGCVKCSNMANGLAGRLTREEFVRRAKDVHNNFYLYGNTHYVHSGIKVCITCPKHGDFWQLPQNHLSGQGCLLCGIERKANNNRGRAVFATRRKAYGIGILDYNGSTNGDKALLTWKNMLKRCYDEKSRSKFPTYNDCYVCDEWLYFSNFKKWFDENYIVGYSLDKDILVKGNRIYSPETCCFVPQKINAMLTKGDAVRGNLPIGVARSGNGFVARISIDKKLIIIGHYDTPEDAFRAYKEVKEKHIKDVAQEYYNKGLISKDVRNALLNYKINITD